MDINQVNTNTSEAFRLSGEGKNNKLGQQQFLQLLVAQMRNQDPINPLDGTEFASQLAQFNSVEQLIDVNDGLKSLRNSQEMMSASLTNSMAASLTGKQVKALTNQVHLTSGEDVQVHYKLKNSAAKVEMIVRNETGSEVRREQLLGVSSGDNTWAWDGKNDGGVQMADGTYTIEVKASNEGGEVDSLVYTQGVATKVRYTGDGVYLFVNNIDIPIGDVEEVGIDIF